MPDVKYPKNPNSDTAFVEEDGKKARAIKVAVVDGTIDYPKNANSDSCYVTVDGQKQRALMVADVSGEGTVEYPNNPNSTKGYVEIDGKKQRVVLTASLAGGGSTPTGTITITENGEHDVTDYATADVQVPTTAPALYRAYQLDANNKLVPNTTISDLVDFTGVTEISAFPYQMAYAYANNTSISGAVKMGNITTLGTPSSANTCAYMFQNCTGITSVDLGSLTTINDGSSCYYMFDGCTGITSVNLTQLQNVYYSNCLSHMFSGCTGLTSITLSLYSLDGTNSAAYMFQNCTGLLSANLSSLSNVYGSGSCYHMFDGCSALTSADVSALTQIINNNGCAYMFANCTALTSLSFPAITTTSFGTRVNQFNRLCENIPNITLHFPSNVQSVIEGLTGYSATAPFGAVSGSVLFDLPATS